MDFQEPEELRSFRIQARKWLDQNAADHLVAPGRETSFDTAEEAAAARAWQATKCDAGWAGLHWPEEYGGRGLSRYHSIVFAQEEAQFGVPRGAFFNIGLNFAAPTLMEYGSVEHRRHHLPRMLRGDEIWCQLFSEPGAGSDLAGLRTRSERDGDDWIVNGQKVWTTYAQFADFAILVTRHDPSLPKHKGLTYFFVDLKSPGVEPRPIRQISGSSHFNEVFLTNVRIPDHQRMGEVGQGWQVAITTLMNERMGASSADSAPNYAHLLELARELELETGPAISDSSIREQIADWYIATNALKLINQKGLSALAQGNQPGPEASIKKLVAGTMQQELSRLGLDLQESLGILSSREVPLEGLFQTTYCACPATRIAGGTDEILRNILAERVLGLPGDIRVDRDVSFDNVPSGSH